MQSQVISPCVLPQWTGTKARDLRLSLEISLFSTQTQSLHKFCPFQLLQRTAAFLSSIPSTPRGHTSSVNCLHWPCVFTAPVLSIPSSNSVHRYLQSCPNTPGRVIFPKHKSYLVTSFFKIFICLAFIYLAAADLSYSMWGQTHWECRVSAAGAPGKSPYCFFPWLSFTFRINLSWGFRFSGETKQTPKRQE